MKDKLKKFLNWLFDILDDVLAYILTIIGILFSTYIPLLKTNGTILIDLNWGRIVLSAIVAIMIIGKQESLESDETGSKIKSKEGRKKRFWARMVNALSQGVMWAQLIQLAT